MKNIMKTFVVLCSMALLASFTAVAQSVKPQGYVTPTDPRECQRQLASDLRNVPMGAFETTYVKKDRQQGKQSDAAQFMNTRQQAMMNYYGCLEMLMGVRNNRSPKTLPVLAPVAEGSK